MFNDMVAAVSRLPWPKIFWLASASASAAVALAAAAAAAVI